MSAKAPLKQIQLPKHKKKNIKTKKHNFQPQKPKFSTKATKENTFSTYTQLPNSNTY
jgi:hypothetical protein